MLRNLYRASGEFFRQLREEFAAPKRVVHALPSEHELFSSLAENHSAHIDEAIAAQRGGDRAAAAELLTGYFRKRENPSFFISPKRIGAAAKDLQSTHPQWVSRTLKHADRMSEGLVNVYAQHARLLSPEDWAAAPAGPVNDILYRYRPHRFAFAPRLALANLYGHEGALPALDKLLADWAQSIRPDARFARRYRTFTTSSHVAIYRSIAVSWTLAFLSAAAKTRVDLEMLCLRIILGDAQHIITCMPHTTRNNHLLADGFGLWYLGSMYPEFNAAGAWKSAGMEVFRRELLRQIYPDGTSFEQSVHYQEHACEMGLAYLVLCRRNDWPAEGELTARIRAMLHFQATLAGADGASFAIGDTTEDPLFPLDGDEAGCAPALRSMYGDLFGVTMAPIEPSIPSLERAFWLSDGRFPEQRAAAHTSHNPLDRFPDGGFAVLNAREGRDRLVLRTGPGPGIEIASGHMHFDFLSIYLAIDGQTLIVPGGTYSYRSAPRGWAWKYGNWRPYFMSARAANGLILSDADPLERPGGDFPGGIGGNIACRVQTTPGKAGDSLTWIAAQVVGTGEHAGWARTVLQVRNDYWLVLDEFPSRAIATPGWFGWQFPVGATVEIEARQTVRVAVRGVTVVMSFSAGLGQPLCLTGSSRPVGGWISHRYGEMSAAPQLLVPTGSTTTVSACVIARQAATSPSIQQVTVSRSGAGMTLRVDRNGSEDHFTIERATDRADTVVHWRRMENGQVRSEESV